MSTSSYSLTGFWLLCYAHNQNHKGDKFATRSIKGVFIGYPHGKKGWRIFDPSTGKIFSSRDVVFCESEFPYLTDLSLVSDQVPNECPVLPLVDTPLLIDDAPPVILEPEPRLTDSSISLPAASTDLSPVHTPVLDKAPTVVDPTTALDVVCDSNTTTDA